MDNLILYASQAFYIKEKKFPGGTIVLLFTQDEISTCIVIPQKGKKRPEIMTGVLYEDLDSNTQENSQYSCNLLFSSNCYSIKNEQFFIKIPCTIKKFTQNNISYNIYSNVVIVFKVGKDKVKEIHNAIIFSKRKDGIHVEEVLDNIDEQYLKIKGGKINDNKLNSIHNIVTTLEQKQEPTAYESPFTRLQEHEFIKAGAVCTSYTKLSTPLFGIVFSLYIVLILVGSSNVLSVLT